MRITFLGIALAMAFFAAPAQAAALTDDQIKAVVDLVSSFGADSSIVKSVEASLRGGASDDKQELKLNAFLKIGSNGEEVRTLQKILATDPALYPEGLVTGFFGPLTELAVKRLQAKLKIEQAGAVGPETLAKLNALLAGITADDLANSRVKIEVKIKDGKEEIKIEVKCDSSGSGNSCKEDDEDEVEDADEDDDDNEDDDEDDEDEDDEDEDEEDDDDSSGSGN